MAEVSASLSGKSLSVVLLLFFLSGACSRGGPPPSAGQPQAIPVKLQSVQTSMVEESDKFVGNLEAAARVELKPETDGRIDQIFVSSGTRVDKGTPIVQLRPEKSQAEVGGAIANVNASRASLNNAQAQLKAAEAERVSAVADLELQNQQYTRISTLVAQGAYARQQLDQVQRDRNAARAALNAAEEKIRAARATIDQENSTLQQAQANVTLRNENLKDTKVVAPIAGIVGDFRLKLGDYVKTGDTLMTILQNNRLDLRLSVPAERASQLRVGLPVELKASKDSTILGTGQISFVSPQINSDTQTILAKASFPNPTGILRDTQQVQATVIWKRNTGVLIPTAAVSRVAGQNFVYVAQTQGQSKLVARQKSVKLDESRIQGNSYPVIEGLQAGEKLIVSGIQNLADGAPIKPES